MNLPEAQREREKERNWCIVVEILENFVIDFCNGTTKLVHSILGSKFSQFCRLDRASVKHEEQICCFNSICSLAQKHLHCIKHATYALLA